MPTIFATATATGDAQAAAKELERALRADLAGREPSLVMVFASTSQPLEELAPPLARAFPAAKLLGASTSGEFTERGDTKGAVVAMAAAGDFEVRAGMGTGLGTDPSAAVEVALAEVPQQLEGFPHRTGILLLDALSGHGEEATLLAATALGEGIRLAGGAAGDDLGMSRTTVAHGDRVATDALVLAVIYSKVPLGVGVSHGHRAISEPLAVTRSEGSVVYEVEGRPAWDVWAEHTRAAARAVGLDPATLTDDEVGPFLLRYEAGLASGAELKIRAPLGRGEDGSLSMACGIPEGAKLRITESVPARQVESAREAARRARAQLDRPAAGAIVFDCICRKLILGDEFEVAVRQIAHELGDVPLAGFETYGEIALDAGDLSGFHNTTSVVLAFPS